MSAGLGRRVFQARLALSAEVGYQVTQSAIAKALGTTGTSVGRYEAGLKVPDLEMIERLAAVLRTTPCYLAFGCSHPHVVGEVPAIGAGAGPDRPLPPHRPTRRELEDEATGPAAPPPPIPPARGGAAPPRGAARTSKGQRRNYAVPRVGPEDWYRPVPSRRR